MRKEITASSAFFPFGKDAGPKEALFIPRHAFDELFCIMYDSCNL